MKSKSTESKKDLKLYKEYFKGRSTAYASQNKDGSYVCIKEDLTDNLIMEHLQGKRTIAIYPLAPEISTCSFTVLDIDKKETAITEKLVEKMVELGIDKKSILVEFSGNKGYHIWLFYEKPIEASKAKKLGETIVRLAEVKHEIEVFPKQEQVFEDNYGNPIKIPLCVHKKSGKQSVFVDKNFKPIRDSFEHLSEVLKIGESKVDEILKKHHESEKNIKEVKNFRLQNTNNYDVKTVQAMKGTKKSKEHMALCPWHDDNRESLSINDINKQFYCHACKAKGTVLSETEQEDKVDTSKFREMSMNELSDALSLTIKDDTFNKITTFLCQLAVYTEDSQFNICFNAPSSSGKSYIPMEIAKLFPEKDVIELGYCSPTAIFHDKGLYIEKLDTVIVDLSKKIILFLDQPHFKLLEHLRSLLSHDKKEYDVKVTNGNKNGLKTKNVKLIGYPSVVFCSAKTMLDEQEQSRFLLLSPQIDQSKLEKSIQEKIKKESNKIEYQNELDKDERRIAIKDRIRAIKQANIKEIIIKDNARIEKRFRDKNENLKPRHSRDVERIMSLIKALALFNLWFRNRKGSTIYANTQDVEDAFRLWEKVSESQDTGVPPYMLNVFKNVILPAYKERENGVAGISRKQIVKKYFEVNRAILSDYKLRQDYIPVWEASGLITQVKEEDNRAYLIIPNQKYVQDDTNENIVKVNKRNITNHSREVVVYGYLKNSR